MKQRRGPQEKKVLSYAKDTRNTVAESRAIARKAIAKRKAQANRALRRAEAMVAAESAISPEDTDMFVARSGRKSWRKIPDAPLGEFVATRLRNRKASGMNTKTLSPPLLETGRKKSDGRPITLNGSTGNGSVLAPRRLSS